MSNRDNAIEHLKKSQHYKNLRDYEPPFNPFEVMGVHEKESPHSKVLAWLLEDEINKKFRQIFVAWIANQDNRFDENTNNELKSYCAEDDNDIEVSCEFGDSDSRIDVLACIESLNLVIGIEVKVWADEQPDQVSRYQDLLKEGSYSNYKNKIVIFLTPWDEPPSTANECSCVRVLVMTWCDIFKIINEVNYESEKIGENYTFRKQFSQHIKRNILMETEEKRLVRDLLREGNNAATIQEIIDSSQSEIEDEATIRKIIDNMPPLTDYLNEWKNIVAEVCGETDFEVDILGRGNAHKGELKIQIKRWDLSSLPFTLMFYKYTNAAIRILIWRDYLETDEYKVIYDKLEKLKNDSDGIIKYNKIPYWPTWQTVLSSDCVEDWENPETVFDLYSEKWKKKAKKILEKQLLEVKNADGKNLLQLIKDNLK